MPGSINDFAYDTRDGLTCYIEHDESNMRGAVATPPFITTANIAARKNKPPSNLRLRQLIYKSDSTVAKRIVVAPTDAIYNDAVSGTFTLTNETFSDPDTSEVFRFSTDIAEKRLRTPSVGDSGLDDGTQP